MAKKKIKLPKYGKGGPVDNPSGYYENGGKYNWEVTPRMSMANGGTNSPIKGTKEQYQAYQDSLDLYTDSQRRIGELKKYVDDRTKVYNEKKYFFQKPLINESNIIPYTNNSRTGESWIDRDYGYKGDEKFLTPSSGRITELTRKIEPKQTVSFRNRKEGDPNINMGAYVFDYQKPVQPIIYQPENDWESSARERAGLQFDNSGMAFAQVRIDSKTGKPIGDVEFVSGYSRPKQQPISIQSLKPDLLQGNNQQLEFNPIGFLKGSYFTRDRQDQEIGGKEYFDKKTGRKIMKNGGKIKWEMLD